MNENEQKQNLIHESTHGSHRRFSVTEGGLTYRLGIHLRLKPTISRDISKRALLSILVTWVPLLVLSAMQGDAVGSHVAIPFLHDFAAQARFLLAASMMIFAEAILGPRVEVAAHHFVESNLVVGDDVAKFDSAVEKGLRWRDSTIAELLLVVLTYAITAMTFSFTTAHVSTWYETTQSSITSMTIAGRWLVIFCIPYLHFLTLRWIWRFFLWTQFLWRMSRLNLRLVGVHPDKAGGLAFVGEAQQLFGVLLFAFSVTLSGVLANEVIYDKFPLAHFAPVIGTYLVVAIAIVLSPLLVFSSALAKTRRLGLREFGMFATEYTLAFQGKWIDKPRHTDETLLGTGDIQSLADLGNSYSFVTNMGFVPFGKRTPIALALACLAPMAPLVLTIMPLGQLLKMLLKALL